MEQLVSSWGPRVIVLLLIVASYWGVYEHGRSVMDAEWQSRWSDRDAGDTQAWAIEEGSAREEEHRRAEAQEGARAQAHEERTIADAGAAGADDTGQRLRNDAAKFAGAVSCPGTDTAAAARGQAATRAAMVLSDLLARADARAGELAKAYDRALIAGLTCEAAYSVLLSDSVEVIPKK